MMRTTGLPAVGASSDASMGQGQYGSIVVVIVVVCGKHERYKREGERAIRV